MLAAIVAPSSSFRAEEEVVMPLSPRVVSVENILRKLRELAEVAPVRAASASSPPAHSLCLQRLAVLDGTAPKAANFGLDGAAFFSQRSSGG
jgi:hypothetical protein